MKIQEPNITVGDLIDQLSIHNRSIELDFSGLDYYRLKQRSDTVMQVEFEQSVYRSKDGDIFIQHID